MYAAIITGAGRGSPSPKASLEADEGPKIGTKRTRRRRRKRNSKRTVTESEAASLESLPCGQSRETDSTDPVVREKPATTSQVASGSLGPLTVYTDSDSSDDSASKPHEQVASQEKLAVPTAIQSMFEHSKDPGPSKHTRCKEQKQVPHTTRDDSTLGYFEMDETFSSDDEAQDKTAIRTDAVTSKPQIGDVSKRWIEEKAQWKFGDSILSTYTCWKCSNVGHLAEDCTVAVKGGRDRSGGMAVVGGRAKIPKPLQSLYAACRELKSGKSHRCSDCGVCSNLACCLDCK